MKKLLSILAAVGLTATASVSVVSCSKKSKFDNKSNNPSHTYQDLEGWINASKAKNGVSKTEVVFVGGRTDVDSLSWLAARSEAVGRHADISDINQLNKKSEVDAADAAFSKYVNGDGASLAKVFSAVNGGIIDPFKVGGNSDPAFNISLMKQYFWKDATSVKDMELHSILVDKVADFFKNGVGKSLIDNSIKQEAQMVNDWKWKSDNQIKEPGSIKRDTSKQVNDVVSAITTKLQAASGPYFLIFNNGYLSGITNGYINYKVFNKDSDHRLDNSTATSDINDFFSYISNSVWGNLPDWLMNNWAPKTTAGDSFVVSNKSVWAGDSDYVATGKTYSDGGADDGTPKTDDGKDKKKDDKKATYVIDPKNYLN